jgi:hypothetical protein
MGNERLVQALIRLVVIFIVAGLSALGANLTLLQDAVDDPVMASLVVSIITAAISAILKYLGGATSQPVTNDGVRSSDRRGEHRPNALAL